VREHEAPPETPDAPRAASQPDPLIGRIVGGRYKIMSKIGAGGMGIVYKAKQGAVDREIAVKVLIPSRLHGEDIEALTRRFHLEARAASRLSHPNTITIYDFGQDDNDGLLYIAMEFLQGQSLEQVLRKAGHLDPARTVRIMLQICSSLAEAHKKGIVHRDIKPDNIFLTTQLGSEQDFVKVLDFGVAKLRGPAEEKEKTLTRAGMIFGTPKYMSPEQARCQALDARSDIYALGVMMYQMLVGQVPFTAEDHVSILLMHCSEPPPPFKSIAPNLSIPAALEEVVFRALEKVRERRFQSAEEFQRALEEIAARHGYVSATGLLPVVTASQTPAFGQPQVTSSPTPVPSMAVTPAPIPLDTLSGLPRVGTTTGASEGAFAGDKPWETDLGLHAPDSTKAPTTHERRGPNLALIGAGAVAVVVLLAGVIYLVVNAHKPEASPDGPTQDAGLVVIMDAQQAPPTPDAALAAAPDVEPQDAAAPPQDAGVAATPDVPAAAPDVPTIAPSDPKDDKAAPSDDKPVKVVPDKKPDKPDKRDPRDLLNGGQPKDQPKDPPADKPKDPPSDKPNPDQLPDDPYKTGN
jgi:serine/threonine-protein kinase